jgi:hypothetical protein
MFTVFMSLMNKYSRKARRRFNNQLSQKIKPINVLDTIFIYNDIASDLRQKLISDPTLQAQTSYEYLDIDKKILFNEFYMKIPNTKYKMWIEILSPHKISIHILRDEEEILHNKYLMEYDTIKNSLIHNWNHLANHEIDRLEKILLSNDIIMSKFSIDHNHNTLSELKLIFNQDYNFVLVIYVNKDLIQITKIINNIIVDIYNKKSFDDLIYTLEKYIYGTF